MLSGSGRGQRRKRFRKKFNIGEFGIKKNKIRKYFDILVAFSRHWSKLMDFVIKHKFSF